MKIHKKIVPPGHSVPVHYEVDEDVTDGTSETSGASGIGAEAPSTEVHDEPDGSGATSSAEPEVGDGAEPHESA